MPHPVLILVHPGSMYGSAEFSLGHFEGRAARDGVLHEIQSHEGSFIVIDGAFSDEITGSGAAIIAGALDRAEAQGLVALRLWGDDSEEPPYPEWSGRGNRRRVHSGQVEAALSIADLLRGAPSIEVIGAWASNDLHGEGCVNSVAAALTDVLSRDTIVRVHSCSVFVPEEFEE